VFVYLVQKLQFEQEKLFDVLFTRRSESMNKKFTESDGCLS